MSFKISKLSGKLYKNEIIHIPFDTNNELYIEFEKWLKNGNDLILFEGTPDEISLNNEKKNIEYINEINKRYNYLLIRALSSSMGKYGDFEYLTNQKNEYTDKYLVAKGLKVSPPLIESIEKEMNRGFSESSLDQILDHYGLTSGATMLDNFFKLIIFKYEYAEKRYEDFKAKAVDFRTKCITLVETGETDKLEQAFDLVDRLDSETNGEAIEILYKQFDEL